MIDKTNTARLQSSGGYRVIKLFAKASVPQNISGFSQADYVVLTLPPSFMNLNLALVNKINTLYGITFPNDLLPLFEVVNSLKMTNKRPPFRVNKFFNIAIIVIAVLAIDGFSGLQSLAFFD